MASRIILSKIEPLDATEKYFYEAINRTKSLELEPRSLTFALINEDTIFSEASVLAKSAISWLETLEANYTLFESKSKYLTTCDESAFVQYCLKNDWSLRKNSKDLIARHKNQFKARFELDSQKVYMIYDSTDPLAKIKLLNNYGEK